MELALIAEAHPSFVVELFSTAKVHSNPRTPLIQSSGILSLFAENSQPIPDAIECSTVFIEIELYTIYLDVSFFDIFLYAVRRLALLGIPAIIVVVNL